MARTCSEKPGKKADPLLRGYTLTSAIIFALIGLCGGFVLGLWLVTDMAVHNAPLFEKIFLTSFVSFSGAAAGLIIGGFVGSTLYRLRRKPPSD